MTRPEPCRRPASRATLAGIQSDFLENEEDDYEEDEDGDEDEDEPALQISVRPSVGGSTPSPHEEESTPFPQEDEITLVGLSWGSQCAPVLPLPPKSTSRAHARPSHSRSKDALPALDEAEGNAEENEGEVESWEEGSYEEGSYEEGSEDAEGEEAADFDVRSVDAPDPARRAHASLVDRVKHREDTIRKEGKALVKQAQSMD